jgi:hypothetical protein
MNANVIAINVCRGIFFGRFVELKSDSPLQFVKEAFCRPPLPQEEKL